MNFFSDPILVASTLIDYEIPKLNPWCGEKRKLWYETYILLYFLCTAINLEKECCRTFLDSIYRTI